MADPLSKRMSVAVTKNNWAPVGEMVNLLEEAAEPVMATELIGKLAKLPNDLIISISPASDTEVKYSVEVYSIGGKNKVYYGKTLLEALRAATGRNQ